MNYNKYDYIKEFKNECYLYDIQKLDSEKVSKLPYTIRILLECCLRNLDEFIYTSDNITSLLNFKENCKKDIEIPFQPSRVILQDFTGVPAVVDLAAMRSCLSDLGKNPALINPKCPVDLVIDHSIQVDKYGNSDALNYNQDKEYERNYKRFEFLKWGQNAFKNLNIYPPGCGIVHQVNLEYAARIVLNKTESDKNIYYHDSVFGTDSHTTMINGLGVLGWGVGGIEAEASMLGQPTSMLIPEVIGVKLINKIKDGCNATDVVLNITNLLRKEKVVGKFVEFFGEGVSDLSVADRATISNMCPEYGATCAFFPIDEESIKYLKLTNRNDDHIKIIEEYYKASNMFKNYKEDNIIEFTKEIVVDLSLITPTIAGPKRPEDKINLKDIKHFFNDNLTKPISFNSYNIKEDALNKTINIDIEGKSYQLTHGSLLIAAITSCTNTSNPNVIISAGLVAKKAVELGLEVPKHVKTSLSPGSQVVTKYLKNSTLDTYLDKLGFNTAGYGCMTCIGNSGDLLPEIQKYSDDIQKIVSCAVLSGNRNFEGRVHPLTRANYLASPPLVVAFALAGKMNIDFEIDPIQIINNKPIYLKDIWPSTEEVNSVVNTYLTPKTFKENYDTLFESVAAKWNTLPSDNSDIYKWTNDNTYINQPPFFKNLKLELNSIESINSAKALLLLGDSITTDHISPAGNILKSSPAGIYLTAKNELQFNSYGSRRGNDEIMVRGTFANTRIKNKLMKGLEGPFTKVEGKDEALSIYDAAKYYDNLNIQKIIIAGDNYGTGSSRDWAAKGTLLLGVKAIIAKSYERIHRSNLIGMGVLPLEFINQSDYDTIDGSEIFNINLDNLGIKSELSVKYNDKEIKVRARIDTKIELEYYKNNGILNYVIREIAKHN